MTHHHNVLSKIFFSKHFGGKWQLLMLLLWVRRFEFLNPHPSISHLKPSFSQVAENQEISYFSIFEQPRYVGRGCKNSIIVDILLLWRYPSRIHRITNYVLLLTVEDCFFRGDEFWDYQQLLLYVAGTAYWPRWASP